MKSINLVSAAVSALVLSVAAVSAQTAPATPGTTAPTAPAATPATPAPATPAVTVPAAPATTGIPAAFANDPIVSQIKTQLNAQGYTITNVVKGANGSYTIDAVNAAGVTRRVVYDAATGTVKDTVAAGAGAMATGMPGDDDGAENDNESDDNGSDDNDGNDNGNDSNDSNDNENDGNDSEGNDD